MGVTLADSWLLEDGTEAVVQAAAEDATLGDNGRNASTGRILPIPRRILPIPLNSRQDVVGKILLEQVLCPHLLNRCIIRYTEYPLLTPLRQTDRQQIYK